MENKMKSIFLTILSISLFSTTAFAQSKVKIKTGNADVVVDGKNTTIKTGNQKVQIKGKKTTVQNGKQVVKIKANDVSRMKKVTKTITCDKNQTLTLKNLKLHGKVAIKAGGNCDLTLTKADVDGTKVALHITGNASVTLIDCSIVNATKKGVAIRIDGNGSLTTKNTKVRGKVKLSKNASYEKSK